jgi:hypothetical protein
MTYVDACSVTDETPANRQIVSPVIGKASSISVLSFQCCIFPQLKTAAIMLSSVIYE